MLYGERVYIRCFTYLLSYLARPVRHRHVVVVRRRDDDVRRRRDDVVRRRRHDHVTTTYDDVVRRPRHDDVRRRRTYITRFSVTFLCKYLSAFLTRCYYTANEFTYDVSRIYLLT